MHLLLIFFSILQIIVLGDFMEKIKTFKTDMADERVDEYKKVNNLTNIDGIKVSQDLSLNFAKVVTVEVLNEKGKEALDKEIGKYITIECKDINYLEENEEEKLVLKINEILKELIHSDKASILVVGLGNYEITPDSLGARVVSKLEITRHLIKFAKEFLSSDVREISSLVPGVLGSTGIESKEIIESVVNKISPDVIIVIDSLMSQSMKRLGKTVQISDKGIVPGAGVGNVREAINEEKLNVPVIAIGVPLVVESSTIFKECLEIFKEKNKDYSIDLEEVDFKNVLDSKDENLIVVSKDIDEEVENLSDIIAKAINNLK